MIPTKTQQLLVLQGIMQCGALSFPSFVWSVITEHAVGTFATRNEFDDVLTYLVNVAKFVCIRPSSMAMDTPPTYEVTEAGYRFLEQEGALLEANPVRFDGNDAA